jgi:FlaG/FlaF family flagellin (archaellin)
MFAKVPRPPLRHSRRGVDVNVATVLLVAMVVVLAAVLFILVRGYISSSSTNEPLGSALAIGGPVDSTGKFSGIAACSATACNFYNFTVQSASSSLELHDLAFDVFAATGTAFEPTGGIAAISLNGAVTGLYSFSGGAWTSGGTADSLDHVELALYTSGASPQSLSDDQLHVIGVAAYSGSITLPIE